MREERRKEKAQAAKVSRPPKGAVWSLFSWASSRQQTQKHGLHRSGSDLFDKHSGQLYNPDMRVARHGIWCSFADQHVTQLAGSVAQKLAMCMPQDSTHTMQVGLLARQLTQQCWPAPYSAHSHMPLCLVRGWSQHAVSQTL